jgi:hypothetical protein
MMHYVIGSPSPIENNDPAAAAIIQVRCRSRIRENAARSAQVWLIVLVCWLHPFPIYMRFNTKSSALLAFNVRVRVILRLTVGSV